MIVGIHRIARLRGVSQDGTPPCGASWKYRADPSACVSSSFKDGPDRTRVKRGFFPLKSEYTRSCTEHINKGTQWKTRTSTSEHGAEVAFREVVFLSCSELLFICLVDGLTC